MGVSGGVLDVYVHASVQLVRNASHLIPSVGLSVSFKGNVVGMFSIKEAVHMHRLS
jgi:hypothetical protein